MCSDYLYTSVRKPPLPLTKTQTVRFYSFSLRHPKTECTSLQHVYTELMIKKYYTKIKLLKCNYIQHNS